MTLTTPTSLRALADIARRRATHHRNVGLGPIPVRLAGTSDSQLARFADPLIASTGRRWAPLQVTIATSATLAPGMIPATIRPLDTDLVVAREDGVIALSSAADGTLWLLDERTSSAMLWIEDESALPLWEHTSPLRVAARWWACAQGGAMVHAGVVGDRERCVLLVGDSGAGKSTTTMACLGSGLDVLGDDFCLLEPPGHDATTTGDEDTAVNTPPIAHTMYRLAKLDERALTMLPHLRDRVVGTAWRGKKLIELPNEPQTPRPIVAVCHVVQDPSSPTRATPVSRMTALRAVAPSTMFQQRLWERETWEVLAATVRATHCHQLSVADLADVPDMIRVVLDHACPAGGGRR